MRFRWTPSIFDLVLPFFLGLVELLLTGMIGVSTVGQWLLVLALISAMVSGLTHQLFKRARQDPENREFFESVAPATLADHVPVILGIGVASAVGSWLWTSGNRGWPALATLTVAFIVVAYQLRINHSFWRTSMGQVEDTPD
jgi:hypothetical protein